MSESQADLLTKAAQLPAEEQKKLAEALFEQSATAEEIAARAAAKDAAAAEAAAKEAAAKAASPVQSAAGAVAGAAAAAGGAFSGLLDDAKAAALQVSDDVREKVDEARASAATLPKTTIPPTGHHADHGHGHGDHGHGDHDHHDHPPITDWPTDVQMGKASPGKIAMWIFLLSDAMSFGGFLLGYAILRARADTWVHPFEPQEFGINFTAGLTFLLICSSVTMVLAVAAAMENNQQATTRWLGLTALGGGLFLCGQLQEYWGTFSFIFGHEGGLTCYGVDKAAATAAHGCLTFGASARATTFYVITGFHGLHVLTGTIYIIATTVQSSKGKFVDGNHSPVEICGLFWHFVDLVWILVFTFVYLIPLPPTG